MRTSSIAPGQSDGETARGLDSSPVNPVVKLAANFVAVRPADQTKSAQAKQASPALMIVGTESSDSALTPISVAAC
jgi:hypothetical protein